MESASGGASPDVSAPMSPNLTTMSFGARPLSYTGSNTPRASPTLLSAIAGGRVTVGCQTTDGLHQHTTSPTSKTRGKNRFDQRESDDAADEAGGGLVSRRSYLVLRETLRRERVLFLRELQHLRQMVLRLESATMQQRNEMQTLHAQLAAGGAGASAGTPNSILSAARQAMAASATRIGPPLFTTGALHRPPSATQVVQGMNSSSTLTTGGDREGTLRATSEYGHNQQQHLPTSPTSSRAASPGGFGMRRGGPSATSPVPAATHGFRSPGPQSPRGGGFARLPLPSEEAIGATQHTLHDISKALSAATLVDEMAEEHRAATDKLREAHAAEIASLEVARKAEVAELRAEIARLERAASHRAAREDARSARVHHEAEVAARELVSTSLANHADLRKELGAARREIAALKDEAAHRLTEVSQQSLLVSRLQQLTSEGAHERAELRAALDAAAEAHAHAVFTARSAALTSLDESTRMGRPRRRQSLAPPGSDGGDVLDGTAATVAMSLAGTVTTGAPILGSPRARHLSPSPLAFAAQVPPPTLSPASGPAKNGRRDSTEVPADSGTSSPAFQGPPRLRRGPESSMEDDGAVPRAAPPRIHNTLTTVRPPTNAAAKAGKGRAPRALMDRDPFATQPPNTSMV